MPIIEFQASRIVPAPPRIVYSVIADYRDGHPRILPKPPFLDLVVEQGGYGAGTVFRCGTRLLGRTQTFRAIISEPEPGRVLVEKFIDQDSQTIFTVDHEADPNQSRVTFHTVMNVPGIAGYFQKWMVPRLLLPIYKQELENLAVHAQALHWVEQAKPA